MYELANECLSVVSAVLEVTELSFIVSLWEARPVLTENLEEPMRL